jgi:perosamine synthetase
MARTRQADPVMLSRPSFGEAEIEAVREVLDSGWVAGQGPRGAELERRFAAKCGVHGAVAVANCTAALHLALIALGCGPGDEVLVADYTYPATGHSVLYTGATPVFVDVTPDTWTIDPDAAAQLVGPRTVGVIAVDVLGQCADYDALRALCDANGLWLLEDAAAGSGAEYRDRPAGSFGDLACFSLHARKGITSGEGGVLVSDELEKIAHARKLSCFGVESAFARQASDDLPIQVFDELGYNYKLSDILAAIALVQLDREPELLAARRRIADLYREGFADCGGFALPVEASDRRHAWQTFALTLDSDRPRADVARALRGNGVQVAIGTFASHLQPVYGDRPPCPTSADLFTRHLAIPMHPGLRDDDVEFVIEQVRDAVAR